MIEKNNKKELRPSNLTLDAVRNKLSGLHFSQEALSKDAKEILWLAESLLFYIDSNKDENTLEWMGGTRQSNKTKHLANFCVKVVPTMEELKNSFPEANWIKSPIIVTLKQDATVDSTNIYEAVWGGRLVHIYGFNIVEKSS